MCAGMQQFHWHPHNNALWHLHSGHVSREIDSFKANFVSLMKDAHRSESKHEPSAWHAWNQCFHTKGYVFPTATALLCVCVWDPDIMLVAFVYIGKCVFFNVPEGSWFLKCEGLPHKSVTVHPLFSAAVQSLGRTAGLWMSSGPPPPGIDSRSEPDTHQTDTYMWHRHSCHWMFT